MIKVSLGRIVAIATDAKDKEWHFHYLTPNCVFNESDLNKIIVEVRDEIFFATSKEKPIKHLEALENLFYGRA